MITKRDYEAAEAELERQRGVGGEVSRLRVIEAQCDALRLAAAAPELLEACQVLLATIHRAGLTETLPQTCELAKAAIAKATGGAK